MWLSAAGDKSGLIPRYGMVIIFPGIPCGMYICIYCPIHHYGDVIMGAIASQITSLTIAYSTVYSEADQRKHQSSASLAFVCGIHRGLVNSPHSNAENVSIWWRHHDSAIIIIVRDMFVWRNRSNLAGRRRLKSPMSSGFPV